MFSVIMPASTSQYCINITRIRSDSRPPRPYYYTSCTPSNKRYNIPLLNTTSSFNYLKDKLGNRSMKSAQKEEALTRKTSKVVRDDPTSESLAWTDAIGRLGMEHRFVEEIDDVLGRQHVEWKSGVHQDKTLSVVALSFRLLRQHGYHVSTEVFNKFKGEDGEFSVSIGGDIKGLLGLYEAAQLRTEDEQVLDEAETFSRDILQNQLLLGNLDARIATQVENTLKYPYHKTLPRYKANKYFQGINGWGNTILQALAAADSDFLQHMHAQELSQISEWLREVGLNKELKLARDQPLKWYTWAMAALADPSLSWQRMELTKSISFVYIIDDIFDLYGTRDDLILFTQAVTRWDLDATEELPDYMKMCFTALYTTTNEIGHKIADKYGYNPVESLQKAWTGLCEAFLVEAKWFALEELPEAGEYLENGIISSGVHIALVHIFFLLGLGLGKASALQLNDISFITFSVAKILRLSDDLGSAKDEKQDGHDGSYIDCYVKENEDCSVELAREVVAKMIGDEWKKLNREVFHLTQFSSTFTKASLNIARMVPLMYSYDENRGLPALEEYVKSTLPDYKYNREENEQISFNSKNKGVPVVLHMLEKLNLQPKRFENLT